MAQRRRGRSIAWLALVALAACSRFDAAPQGDTGLRIRFEDQAEPDVFAREAPAVRDAKGGSPGLWAAVTGLPRPERGLVVNPANGDKVVVALFIARSGAPAIRLSNEAADALGIGDRPATVRITALRREPRLDTTKGRF